MINLQLPINNKTCKRIFISLICAEIILVSIYFIDFWLAAPIERIHFWFDLDSEVSIPTWFSTIQLFMIGLIPLMVAYNTKMTPPPSKKGLTIFGLGFIYLSMDEGSSIHERLTYEFYNNPLVPYFHGTHGIWIVVYGAIGIIVLLFLFKDIWAVCKTFKKEALIFIIGMIIFLAGTGGSETITFFFIDKTNPITYALEVCLEEFTEMVGASTLLLSVWLMAVKKLELPTETTKI